MSRICLVVSFYDGGRDGDQGSNYKDYLKCHKEVLKNTKHNLTKIVFAIAGHPDKIEEIDGITYLYRPNCALGFGGWIDAYKKYQNEVDYFIFCEDDYLYTLDNFDIIMKKEYTSGYLITWKSKPHLPNWANSEGISTIGMVSTEEMRKYDKSDWDVYKTCGNNKCNSMVFFMKAFKNIYSMKDYGFVYYNWITKSNLYYKGKNGILCESYQHYKKLDIPTIINE